MAEQVEHADNEISDCNIVKAVENGRRSKDCEERTVPDGGWGWAVVFASFISSIIYEGCNSSFGILYVEFLNEFQDTKSNTAWIGSLFLSMPLLCSPLSAIITRAIGSRKAAMLGGFISAIGFLIGGFSTSLWMLAVCYGLISGFGTSLPYFNSYKVVTDYFHAKLSLATGLSECGTGIGTVVFVPFTRYLVSVYGWRGTLIITSAIVANDMVCGALYRPIKQPGRPQDGVSASKKTQNDATGQKSTAYMKHLRSKSFLIYATSCFVMYFWYDVPYVFMIDRAEELGITTENSSHLLLVLGVFRVVGTILYGFIGVFDFVNYSLLYGVSIMISGTLVFLVPFVYDFIGLAVICGLFGLFASSTETLLPCILIEIVGKQEFDNMFCGLVLFLEGVANLTGPPFAGLLFDLSGKYDLTFSIGGGCILFTGCVYVYIVIKEEILDNSASKSDNASMDRGFFFIPLTNIPWKFVHKE